MHRTLIRQLRKLGLESDKLPDPRQWQALLQAVSTSYQEADDGLYLVERSLRISSEEMTELHARHSQQLEGRLQAILGALPDVLFLIDDQGRYLEAMAGDDQLLVAPAEQMRSRRMHDFMPRNQAERFLAAVHAAIDSGELQVLKYRLATRSGEQRSFEGRVAPTGYQVDGHATAVFLARDITLQESSQRNARLLETVISAAREGVVIVAEDRNVLYANPAAAEITGYSPQELTTEGLDFLRNQLDKPGRDSAACPVDCAENPVLRWSTPVANSR